MTYCPHWKLDARPFDNLPDPRFYFPSGQHEDARQRLLYGIEAKKGAVMLTGEIGCGKTLMSRALIQNLPAGRYDVALIANPSLPSLELLTEILYQLGLEAGGQKVTMLHRLNDHLLANRARGIATVLMVDEVQAVRDPAVFEDIRLLLNFQLNDGHLLTLVLVGQPELNDRVRVIPQLDQRIGLRYHLRPFSADETVAYVRFRLQAAGGRADLFTKDALQEVFVLSHGVCRVINNLCDLSLFLGAQERVAEISPSLVQRAATLA